MANPWTLSNRSVAGAAATATQAAPASGAAQGMCARLRALQCSINPTAAGTDQLVLRDGASGVGAILWTMDLTVAVGAIAVIALSGLDIRGTPGNALTLEWVSGVATDREAVNGQGDYVPQGYPIGAP